MTPATLAAAYPRLFHMAEAGAWPSIRAHGLESAAALVTRFGADPALLSARRARAVTLTAPGHEPVVLRDNGVLHDGQLARCLVGMDVPAFYRMLNGRVYFWPTRERVEKLLRARAYRRRPHLVLELDTAELLARHDVRLSPINMGTTFINPPRRGPDTAAPPADFPWRGRRSVAEVSVEGSVPDAAELVVAAAIHDPDGGRTPV